MVFPVSFFIEIFLLRYGELAMAIDACQNSSAGWHPVSKAGPSGATLNKDY
jgi:hypothetical protein